MSYNTKILKLVGEGFKIQTLKKMSDHDIDMLHKKVFSEATTTTVQKTTYSKQDVQAMKNKNAGIKVDDGTVVPNDDGSVTVTTQEQEMGEADVNTINPFDGKQTQDPKQVGPSSNDGMDNYQDGMVDEEVDDNPYAICTSSLGLVGRKRDSYTKEEKKKFERCVIDVKKESVRKIEESLVSLILKNEGMITKKDILEQEIAPAKPTTKPGTKPGRSTPYKPKHSPKPKASDTETAPTRVKPGTKERPDRKTPYKPKHSPKPKAKDKTIPDFFKFDNINITFKDE